MSNYQEIDPTELIESVAEELKKIEGIKAPDWAQFVKTGNHKERVPDQDDWWHTRVAAILRRVGVRGPVGVGKLRVHFGGKKNRGMKPEKFALGSGNIIRKSLQQLETAGLIKKQDKDVHKGRVITPKGVSILDKQAVIISKQARKELLEEEKRIKELQKQKEQKKEHPKEVKKEQPKELPKQEAKKQLPPKEAPKELPKKEVPKELPKKEEPKELPKKEEKKELPPKEAPKQVETPEDKKSSVPQKQVTETPKKNE